MARTYKAPPLIEAICEFRFTSSQPWDWTIPGLVYEQIKKNLPYKEQVNTVEMKVDPMEGKVVQQSLPKMRFLNEDRTSLIQVGPDILSIHQLRPYDMWNNYKARILKYLQIYYDEAKPLGFARAGLRYVNRIELPYEDVELEDYFCVLPKVPHPVPQVFPSFLLQVDIPYSSAQSVLRIVFGALVPGESANLAYALDVDMYSLDNAVPKIDQISDWLETAHNNIETAFDVAFTERTHREIFKEVSV